MPVLRSGTKTPSPKSHKYPSPSTPPNNLSPSQSQTPKHTPNSNHSNNKINNSNSSSRRRSLRLSSTRAEPEPENNPEPEMDKKEIEKINVNEVVNNVLADLRVSDSEEEGSRKRGRRGYEERERDKGKGVLVVEEEEERERKRFTREEKGKGIVSSVIVVDEEEEEEEEEERVDLNVAVSEDDDESDENERFLEREREREKRERERERFEEMAMQLMRTLEGLKHNRGIRAPENLAFPPRAARAGRAPPVVVGEGGNNNRGVGENVEVGQNKSRMDKFKEIARSRALDYAHYNAQDEEEVEEEDGEDEDKEEEVAVEKAPSGNVEDWPGPFSTAMKIIRDREKSLGGGGVKDVGVVGKGGVSSLVSWIPKVSGKDEGRKLAVPSLQVLCLRILVENVDAISSLDGVPDVLRHKLSQMVCDSRRMNEHFLGLLLKGSPSEIRLADCSWLEEDKFENAFEDCDTSNLTVLQLDLCGHCMSDSSLLKALVPKPLNLLTTLSLKGACRISDVGMRALISSAPSLKSVNLSQCTLLTNVGINDFTNSLDSIHELYLDDCEGLDAKRILPGLKKLKHLEVLSLRGIASVSDKFIRKLIRSIGQNMKELVLANCTKLSDASLKIIAETCSQLCVLDLSHLTKLTDIGMAHLANGCRGIQVLKLCRSSFSDEAVAAFLEASGESLMELSLNNISKVGQNTTISLSRRCKNLEILDLSWCRSLTDEAMGLIADTCNSLRVLKIFGCTQVSKTFLEGHSNPHLQVIGLKLTPILENIKRPDFQQGPLHYSAVATF